MDNLPVLSTLSHVMCFDIQRHISNISCRQVSVEGDDAVGRVHGERGARVGYGVSHIAVFASVPVSCSHLHVSKYVLSLLHYRRGSNGLKLSLHCSEAFGYLRNLMLDRPVCANCCCTEQPHVEKFCWT